MDKVTVTAAQALVGIQDGRSLAVGGSGPSGVPDTLIRAVYERGAGAPAAFSGNRGTGPFPYEDRADRSAVHRAVPAADAAFDVANRILEEEGR